MSRAAALDRLRSFLRRIQVRIAKLLRPVSDRLRHGQVRLASTIRRLPLPDDIRQPLYRYVPWRPWSTFVSPDKLLLGAQNRYSAQEFSTASGDLLWASTPVGEGPHADLLRSASVNGLTDEELLGGPYGRFARTVIQVTGNYFDATDDAGIVRVARRYLNDFESSGQGTTAEVEGRSRAHSLIRVSRIRGSDCYQLVDGHHRAAGAAVRGENCIPVRTSWLKVSTPLQDLLNNMTWIGGQRELYQPLHAPELKKSWKIVRQCTDRQAKMLDFLVEDGLLDREGTTYLDVASCYGWFVAQMLDNGLDAYGVERDPLAPQLGLAAYGLAPQRITTGDAVSFLRQVDAPYDVVSCLSLLHHFALGRAVVNEVELIRLLDSATARVLFFETGESHEEWLRGRLPGWSAADVHDFLRRETTFDHIIDLGPDEDAVPPYQANYGRHLFACVRDPR